LAVLLVIGGIVAFYVLSALPAWQRWLIVVGSLALAAGALAWSAYGRSLWQFALDSRVELRKIVWPNREETLQVTLVVFVMLIVLALFFWALDSLLGFITRWLASGGG